MQTNTSPETFPLEQISTQNISREAMIELARRMEEKRYKFYVPNGRGEGFLAALGSARYFITLYSAANGVGKTTSLVCALAEMMWPTPGGHPWIKGPLFEKYPYLKKIRIISDPHVVESIISEMKKWFPTKRYVSTKGRKAYEAYWRTDTGFDLDIMTYDQDPKEFESANLGFIWMDEPPPRSVYKASIARLRSGGQIAITATPLRGSEWMYDEILANPNNEKGLRTFIEATMEDACIQHGVRGHLEHENIQKIISQYDEDEKQARVYGKFQHLTGLVFKQFDQKIHVIKPFPITHKDFTVHNFLDLHPRTQDAVGWYAIDKYGRKYVIDEMFEHVDGDGELAFRIKEKDSLYRVTRHVADPSAFIEDQHRQTSIALSLQKQGLYYEAATKARASADRRIKTALNFTMVGDHILQPPEIFIFDTCVRHIWELQHYRWDEWTGRNADKHGQKQKPLDKDDHMIENLGRFLFSEPAFESYYVREEQFDSPNDDPYG